MPFDRSAGWSVGVEEELMLVDEQTFDLVAAADLIVGSGEPPGSRETPSTGPLRGQAAARPRQSPKHELLGSMIELTTGVCATPDEAAERMRVERERVRGLVSQLGLRLLASGSHPFATPEDQPITDDPTYLEFVRFAGPVARRQAVCGLHVHIGMPDGDTALRALDALLPWLPVVLAVSANSPFFRGDETGFVSTRAEVLLTLPRSSAPPDLGSFAEWEALMDRWRTAGAIQRFTNAWWDARINPEFGTLELRIADQPTDVDTAARLVAALHRLAVLAASGELVAQSHKVDYPTNRFAASRFGPRAQLIWDDRLVAAGELAAELGLDPTCEADRQLEHRGDLRGLCADLVARS